MDRAKGVAYCGLACCVSGKNTSCAGCRNDGYDKAQREEELRQILLGGIKS